MDNIKGITAFAAAVQDAKAAHAKEAAEAKLRRERRCGACSRRRAGGATVPPPLPVAWYPVQGAGPLTACRFTIQHTREILVGVGPQSYYNERTASAFTDTLNKVTSTRGVSLGARLAPRFYQLTVAQRRREREASVVAATRPHVLRYHQPPVRPNTHPFNSSSTRKPIFLANAGPGPGLYEVCAARDRRIPFQEHLGSGRTMVPAVQVRCCPASEAQCDGCGEAPRGDFWRSHSRMLCLECMREEQAGLSRRARSAGSAHRLREPFTKVRDCSEVHCHEGTGAAMRLRTERQQQRARVREAYLSLYF